MMHEAQKYHHRTKETLRRKNIQYYLHIADLGSLFVSEKSIYPEFVSKENTSLFNSQRDTLDTRSG